MKNVVSFETARRLKEAGFPQPQFDIRQTWYSIGGVWPPETEIYIAEKNEKAMRFITVSIWHHAITGVQEAERECEIYGDEVVFAPTATDILRELGCNYVLWFDESPKIKRYFCAKTGDSFSEAGKPFEHIEPAEAAALAWLAINEKK